MGWEAGTGLPTKLPVFDSAVLCMPSGQSEITTSV